MEAVSFFETSENFNGITLRQKVLLFIVTHVTASVIKKMLTFVTYGTIFGPIVTM
jgi:hypothetical protein